MFKSLFSAAPLSGATDWATLLLRVSFGFMMAYNHGATKFHDFPAGSAGFPDPLGVGETTSMGLTVFAELLCGILVGLGAATRPAALILVFTMLMAAINIHWNDTLEVREHALLFAFGYFAIYLLGAGRFSIDALLNRRNAG